MFGFLGLSFLEVREPRLGVAGPVSFFFFFPPNLLHLLRCWWASLKREHSPAQIRDAGTKKELQTEDRMPVTPRADNRLQRGER